MMTFVSVLTEEQHYIERDGAAFAYDKNGKEYEITPSMMNRYFDKYGGRWKIPAWMLGGGLIGGALALPASIGTREILKSAGASPGVGYVTSAIPRAALLGGGLALGFNHGLSTVYNDIAKKRLSGEFK